MIKFIAIFLILLPLISIPDELKVIHFGIENPEESLPYLNQTLNECCNGDSNSLVQDLFNNCPKTSDLSCFKDAVDLLSDTYLPNMVNKLWRAIPPQARDRILNVTCSQVDYVNNFTACLAKVMSDPEKLFSEISELENPYNDYQIEQIKKLSMNLNSFDISGQIIMYTCLKSSSIPLSIDNTKLLYENCGNVISYPLSLNADYAPESIPVNEEGARNLDTNLENLRPSNFMEAEEQRNINKKYFEESDSDSNHNQLASIVNNNLFSGYSQNYCPDYLKPYNCVYEGSEWSLSGNLGENISKDLEKPDALLQLYDDVKDILVHDLAQHKMQTIAETYILGLISLNPDDPNLVKQKSREILNAANSCLDPETYNTIENQISSIKEITPERQKELTKYRREQLAPELIISAHSYDYAKTELETIQPMFEMSGECGYFGKTDYECQLLHGWRSIHLNTQNRISANYPFMHLETSPDTTLMEEIAFVGNNDFIDKAYPENGEGTFDKNLLNSEDINNALHLYDSVIETALAKSKDAMMEACKKPKEAGLSVLTNPALSQSFFTEKENHQKGWVFCSLYAETKEDDNKWQALKMGGMIGLTAASIIFTGGLAGYAFLALDAAMVSYDTYNNHYSNTNLSNNYIAGVGNLSEYLAAEKALDDFVYTTTRDFALVALGGLGEGLDLYSKYRQFKRTQKLIDDPALIRRAEQIEENLATTARAELPSRHQYRDEFLNQLNNEEIIHLNELSKAGEVFEDVTALRTAIKKSKVESTKSILSQRGYTDDLLRELNPDQILKLENISSNAGLRQIDDQPVLESFLKQYIDLPEGELILTISDIKKGHLPDIPPSIRAGSISNRNRFLDTAQKSMVESAYLRVITDGVQSTSRAYPGGAQSKALIDVEKAVGQIKAMCKPNSPCLSEDQIRHLLNQVDNETFIEYFKMGYKNKSKSPYTAGAIDPVTGISSIRKNIDDFPDNFQLHESLARNKDDLVQNYQSHIEEGIASGRLDDSGRRVLQDGSSIDNSIGASQIPGLHAEVLAANDVLNFKRTLKGCLESRNCRNGFECFNDRPIKCDPNNFENIRFSNDQLNQCTTQINKCFPDTQNPQDLFFDVRGSNPNTALTSTRKGPGGNDLTGKFDYIPIDTGKNKLKSSHPHLKNRLDEFKDGIKTKCGANIDCQNAYMTAVANYCKKNNPSCKDVELNDDFLNSARQEIIQDLNGGTTMGAGHRCFNCWHILGQENFTSTLPVN